MESSESENFDLPGFGSIKARPGTATHTMAGAVKFWHYKYQSARGDGFIAGASFMFALNLAFAGAYWYLRSR